MRENEDITVDISLKNVNEVIRVWWRAESSSWGHHLARQDNYKQCRLSPLGLKNEPLPHGHTGATQKGVLGCLRSVYNLVIQYSGEK